MTERIPPNNEEAEKSVLGAAMLNKDALFDVVEKVKAEDFYYQNHREIFEGIITLYRKNAPVDILTVSEELKKRKTLDMAGGRSYVAGLADQVPSTSNAGEYAKIVSEKAVLRSLIKAGEEIVARSFQDKMEASSILDFSEQAIFNIAQHKQTKDFAQLKDVLQENIDHLDRLAAAGGHLPGLATGFTDLDSLTSGLQKSDLIILAARPGMGKTAFALNVAMQAAFKEKAKTLVFSMEMGQAQLGQRLLAMEARVDMQKLKTGSLDGQDWDSVSQALSRLAAADIFIDDTPGLTIMELKNKCRRLKAEKGLDLVIVDYLQLMSGEGRGENRQQEISTLSRNLKQLAREIDCPVVVLSQLSRASKDRSSPRPVLTDLRDSGAIEQDADIVIFLYRDDYYTGEDSTEPGICEVIIAKHRSGPTGTVKLNWQGRYTRFTNLAKKEI